ncbi:unnamed protein product [Camellia sinensis]
MDINCFNSCLSNRWTATVSATLRKKQSNLCADMIEISSAFQWVTVERVTVVMGSVR